MRVVLIAGRFPIPSETFIAGRFQKLLERGWDMHVVCSGSDEEDWAFFPELAATPGARERVHQRPRAIPRWALVSASPFWLLRLLVWAPRATLRYLRRGWGALGPSVLSRLYRDAPLVMLDPDLVHFTFGELARGREHLGELLDGALVVSFQGADMNYVGLGEDPGWYAELWDRADALHFLGDDLRRRAARRGYPPDERARVIKPGVDLGAFAPPKRQRAGDEPLRILGVGRLHWKKGYEYALHAVRLLVDQGVPCVYRIIGGGERDDAVLFARHDLGLDDVVELLGPQPSSRVREEMRWADVLLHAATSEGFCYVAVEAQAMELPVVTSNADGLPENVADQETGFVVPRRDPAALATALARLAKDPELRREMGRAARKRAEREFEVELEIDGFEELYRQAVVRRSGRPAGPSRRGRGLPRDPDELG